MDLKFYICEHCGNIITLLRSSGAPVSCCGDPMKELVANTTDAAQEKHVPVVEISGSHVTVKVGTVAHPMLEAHYIMWICLQTSNGYQVVHLKPGDAPEAVFELAEGVKAEKAYAYCNMHGLWRS